jgi:magnesium chelatase family protein
MRHAPHEVGGRQAARNEGRNRLHRKECLIDEHGHVLLRQAMDALGLSARAYDKILKVARTIADLEDADSIRPAHLSEAINYRTLDRRLE